MRPVAGTKIVLSGGPCAGKTTLVQMAERAFPGSVISVPESASLLFSGGFPRFPAAEATRAAQRAIYRVQLELEAAYGAQYQQHILVLDRGTLDGAAYWPEGPAAFFAALGTSLEAELKRYEKVIYLESAGREDYLRHKAANPYRREDWEEARRLDVETRKLWSQHPNFSLVHNDRSFERKVLQLLATISSGIPFAEEKK